MNWHYNIWILLFVIACVNLHTSVGSFNLKKPVRPEKFRSVEELRRYLRELKSYFAIIGRPRY